MLGGFPLSFPCAFARCKPPASHPEGAMMEPVGSTRITMRTGATYLTTESVDTIAEALGGNALVGPFSSVTGQQAFPPERLWVRAADVISVQECSAESWVWIQRAAELHYAQQLQETSPQDRLVAAFERVVDGE